MSAATLEPRHRRATPPIRCAAFATRFALPRDARGEPLVYLCGHSLGLQPLAAREMVNEELDDWARLGVLGPRAGAPAVDALSREPDRRPRGAHRGAARTKSSP